jgi:cytochrome c peroxidase
VRDQSGDRNSPVAYNRILSTLQFWDGRAATLEDQAKGPIANPIEMGNTHDVMTKSLKGIEGYQLQFDKIFPGKGLTIDTVAQAIASFERVLVTGPGAADFYEPLMTFEQANKDDLKDLAALKKEDPETYEQYWKLKRASDAHPISSSAIRGRALFFGKANCTACHAGANFTDEKFHNIGIGMDKAKPDLGRFNETKVEKDKGAFKTPTVRNVTQTGPYMHDGSLKTIEEVVEWYDKGGHANPYLSDKMKKLNLTAQEKEDLIAYMKALTGTLPPVETKRLPK